VLELQCSNETIEMSNHNFPVRKKFIWSPKSCEDVTFKILVGDVELIKKYSGPMGFASFLSDFEKGSRTFYPKEFPDEKTKLGIMGIRYITVKYRIKGHRPVISVLRRGPGQVPKEIVRCWEQ
jgi:type VI secretion system protein ImpL